MRIWDAEEGGFVDESVWREKEKAKHAETVRILTESREEPLQEEIDDNNARDSGIMLSGSVMFKGDVGVRVRRGLMERGYKDKRYDGTLQKILPEDRTIQNFVEEAIYWYCRELGMNLKETVKED